MANSSRTPQTGGSVTRVASLFLVVIAVLTSVLALAPAAHAGPGEGDFFHRTNSSRSTSALRGLVSKADLVTVARRHAQRMATEKRLFHNPNLGREVTGWRVVGENVGMGATPAPIHQAFMNSSSHRANILHRGYTEVGMGTATDSNGRLYIVQVYRQR
ncbi:MAG TPA: CAP domain-containing protein [Mycobacteriales bacterium]|nr:CAP domain-containing protein [Mycobacteriales bacterium]